MHEAAHAAHAHFYEPNQVEIDSLDVLPLEPGCSGCVLVLLEDENAGNATDRAVRALIGDYTVSRLVENEPRVAPLDALAYAAGLRDCAPETGGLNWGPEVGDVRNAGEALARAVRGGVYESFEQAYGSAVDLLQARSDEISDAVLALANACLVDRHLSGADVISILDAARQGAAISEQPAGLTRASSRLTHALG